MTLKPSPYTLRDFIVLQKKKDTLIRNIRNDKILTKQDINVSRTFQALLYLLTTTFALMGLCLYILKLNNIAWVFIVIAVIIPVVMYKKRTYLECLLLNLKFDCNKRQKDILAEIEQAFTSLDKQLKSSTFRTILQLHLYDDSELRYHLNGERNALTIYIHRYVGKNFEIEDKIKIPVNQYTTNTMLNDNILELTYVSKYYEMYLRKLKQYTEIYNVYTNQ